MGHPRRPQVVIVDDHQSFRATARDCLTARGYDVVAEASCAATAMRAVERHDPDAMLLDIHLGDDDGFAVCDAVTRVRPDLAVILTSVQNYEHFREKIESCGARGFIRKAHLATVDLQPVLAAGLRPRHAGGRRLLDERGAVAGPRVLSAGARRNQRRSALTRRKVAG